MQGVDSHHYWVRKRLCADSQEIPAGTGIALLWIQGDVQVTMTHRNTPLNTGDMLITDRIRSKRLEGSVGWSAEALYIENRQIIDHIGDRRFLDGVALRKENGLVKIMRQLWLVGDNLLQTDPKDRLVGVALIDLVTRLSIRMVAGATEARAPVSVVDTVERARGLIRTHLADHHFGAAELARKMQVSPRHLSSLFAPFGTTAARAILEMRIERSKELLGDPVNAHRQIADMALACGFGDQNYFSRCFRTIIGQSPREFRNNKDFSVGTLA